MILSSALVRTSVILAGKRDSRRLSTSLNVRSFIILCSEESLTSFNKSNRANVSGEQKYVKLSGMSIYL